MTWDPNHGEGLVYSTFT